MREHFTRAQQKISEIRASVTGAGYFTSRFQELNVNAGVKLYH
jgi:hypothetical protein